MTERGKIQGWAYIRLNRWLDTHYFRLGKAMPICNAGVNNFNYVSVGPKNPEFKCARCVDLLGRQQERTAIKGNE